MDGLLKKYGGPGLPLLERAKLGALPDSLTVQEIAKIAACWTCGEDLERARRIEGEYQTILLAAAKRGELKTTNYIEGKFDRSFGIGILTFDDYTTTREYFADWLESLGEALPDWWYSPDKPINEELSNTRSKTRRDRLDHALEVAINALQEKYNRFPAAAEIFHYLANDDTTDIIQDSTETELIWSNTQGSFSTTTFKALANRLPKHRHK